MEIWTVLLERQKERTQTDTKINTDKTTWVILGEHFHQLFFKSFPSIGSVSHLELQSAKQCGPFPHGTKSNQSPASLSLSPNTHRVYGEFYTSSSFSSMLGIPLEIGNSRPDSGHCRHPSITSTCSTHREKQKSVTPLDVSTRQKHQCPVRFFWFSPGPFSSAQWKF